ncbi:MAG: hypothetical protein IJT34_00825 [Butyrivibrio sp.]|nr:hypothetical protein [Butyrivibrio sp.]
MRSFQCAKLTETLNTLLRGCDAVQDYCRQGQTVQATDLLASCQAAAIRIGESIERIDRESSRCDGTEVVRTLEGYCEAIYRLHTPLSSGQELPQTQTDAAVEEQRILLRQAITQLGALPICREVVFLPYKAAMWDSLEPVWRQMSEDPLVTAIVIPIPYYDRNPDMSFGELHDESGDFPPEVPITRASDYDFGARRPDAIYIHNPYDAFNRVTSVHPFFYSDHLKKFTPELVYIPYFVLGEPDPDNEEQLDRIEHFITVPAMEHADRVIVQSEAMREAYIRILTKAYGEQSRQVWERKIEGTGSPKIDRVTNLTERDQELPDAWRALILRPDGTRRKVILYNTGVTAMLENDEEMLAKIRDNLSIFYENREDVVLLWRPHPLIEATLSSMRPQLLTQWQQIVAQYRAAGWGIYDDTPELDRAIAVSDAYYGDWSSLVQLYQQTGKPIMIQNCEIRSTEPAGS